MKAVIFGINSQDGFYLSQILEKSCIEVIGVSRSKGPWTAGSVADPVFTEALIRTHQPTFVFHLAASSTTKHSAVLENNDTISNGTLYILEAVKQHSPHTKVFITGSGLQFVNNGLPIKETDAFDAQSAYSMSRIQSIFAARYYRSLGIKTYVGYLFHHESPRRKQNHISKYISDSVKRIMSGTPAVIELGDISVKKEWAFAGDIAAGIFTLVSQDRIFETTIGTGLAYSIEDFLKACFDTAGLQWKDHVLLRDNSFKAEYPLLVSDPGTITSIGWTAGTDFHSLVNIMMQ